MKYELLFKILFDILSGELWTNAELAQKYGVTERTMYRYTECLQVSGIPIVSIRGRKGGIKIMDSFKLPASFMTEEEYEAALSAMVAINDGVPSETLKNAINKLKAVSKESAGTINVKSGNLIIDDGNWGETGGNRAKLALIEKCIEGAKVLKIRYHDRNGETTERATEPYYLVFKQGLWYVYAFCRLRGDFRLFKASRITSVNESGETFKRRAASEVNLDFSNWFKHAETIEALFAIDKSVRSDAEEWLGTENLTETDGKITAKAKVPYEDSLVSKILSFGGKIKVIAPESLKTDVMAKALEIAKNYLSK